MTKGAKTVLFVVLGLVLAAVATCGGFGIWLYAQSDELEAKGKSAMHEGAQFGGGKAAPACLDEALRRLDGGDLGIVGEATNKIFLEACLDVATMPAGFCDGVPPRDSIIDSAKWALARCERAGRAGSQPCTRLVGAVQERCFEAR